MCENSAGNDSVLSDETGKEKKSMFGNIFFRIPAWAKLGNLNSCPEKETRFLQQPLLPVRWQQKYQVDDSRRKLKRLMEIRKKSPAVARNHSLVQARNGIRTNVAVPQRPVRKTAFGAVMVVDGGRLDVCYFWSLFTSMFHNVNGQVIKTPWTI